MRDLQMVCVGWKLEKIDLQFVCKLFDELFKLK